VRVRGRAAPWWLAAAYIAAIIPADFFMATGMLRGLKHRAEHAQRTGQAGWPVLLLSGSMTEVRLSRGESPFAAIAA
jgi:hypothetical protein